jgi:hypothetical protein
LLNNGNMSSSIDIVQQFNKYKTLANQFQKIRRKTIELVEVIVNLKNKKTFLTKEHLSNEALSVAKVSLTLDEDYFLHLEALRANRSEILLTFQSMSVIMVDLANTIEQSKEIETTIPVDFKFLKDIHEQINQQTMLDEMTVHQLIESVSQDQDELVTLLSCLKYSPYLKENEFRMLLDIR